MIARQFAVYDLWLREANCVPRYALRARTGGATDLGNADDDVGGTTMSCTRKVVCVGLGKTGTTSLARFLSQLGLKHYSNFNDARQYYSGNTEYFLSLAERHDSLMTFHGAFFSRSWTDSTTAYLS